MELSKGLKKERHSITSGQNLCLEEQVSQDITSFITAFGSKALGIKDLSSRSDLSEKTIRRLQKMETSPSRSTIIKLYCAIFGSTHLDEILNVIPSIIRESIGDLEIDKMNFSKLTVNKKIEQLLDNSVAIDIFLKAGSVGISLIQVKSQFGSYGIKILNQLRELALVRHDSDMKFILGSNEFMLSPAILKKMAELSLSTYFKPRRSDEDGRNFCSFYAEGLSEKAYLEWIRIEQESYNKKMQVLKMDGAKGNIPAFTIQFVDTLTEDSDD